MKKVIKVTAMVTNSVATVYQSPPWAGACAEGSVFISWWKGGLGLRERGE